MTYVLWQVHLQRESLSIMRDMKTSLGAATSEMNEKANQHKRKTKNVLRESLWHGFALTFWLWANSFRFKYNT